MLEVAIGGKITHTALRRRKYMESVCCRLYSLTETSDPRVPLSSVKQKENGNVLTSKKIGAVAEGARWLVEPGHPVNGERSLLLQKRILRRGWNQEEGWLLKGSKRRNIRILLPKDWGVGKQEDPVL